MSVGIVEPGPQARVFQQIEFFIGKNLPSDSSWSSTSCGQALSRSGPSTPSLNWGNFGDAKIVAQTKASPRSVTVAIPAESWVALWRGRLCRR